MGQKNTYETVLKRLKECGYDLDVSEDEYRGVTITPLFCHDSDGYKYRVIYDQILRSKTKKVDRFNKSNPFTIENINLFLKKKGLPFRCTSAGYHGSHGLLDFQCLRCETVIQKTWGNVFRSGEKRNYIVCPNCDTRVESLHASVLKQMFLREHPDTIVEDPSFRNPFTNRICPTDIVNHRLKIAIEIQSQWHDFPDIKKKDGMKKIYWLNRGYAFYDPDIRNFSVLEMCRLFFPTLKGIPEDIDLSYGHGVNAFAIQQMLDARMSVSEIATALDISPHRIHDAVKSGKLSYPEYYGNARKKPVEQCDSFGNVVGRFNTIGAAARYVGGDPSTLRSKLRSGSAFYKNYYWRYINNKTA